MVYIVKRSTTNVYQPPARIMLPAEILSMHMNASVHHNMKVRYIRVEAYGWVCNIAVVLSESEYW